MSAIDLLKKRRTQHSLGNKLPMPQKDVEELIRVAVREAPSAFNSQSSRVAILFGKEHQKLWNLVAETLRPIVPADKFAPTQTKIDGFAAGAGTVLFFEDDNVIAKLQQDFPLYADKFPEFSGNSAGMSQFAVWMALAHENIGASLQHYHPLIDDRVATQWGLPKTWRLTAQMPFGSNEQGFSEKQYMDDSHRFRVFA